MPRLQRGFLMACLEAGRFFQRGCDRILNRAPVAHQNLPESSPRLCTGGHQRGCDLEEVEGQCPTHHSFTALVIMSEHNIQDQVLELTDDQLERVEGGRSQTANAIVAFIPFVGPINQLSQSMNGPTIGDLF